MYPTGRTQKRRKRSIFLEPEGQTPTVNFIIHSKKEKKVKTSCTDLFSAMLTVKMKLVNMLVLAGVLQCRSQPVPCLSDYLAKPRATIEDK